MSDGWTPIEKAGKYDGPIVLIDREPIIRRLQDGLIASRATLTVNVHRPKVYADTSHIKDPLAAAIADQRFQWGEPVEEREANVELPAACWASDKLGHAWLDLWHSGDARLESVDGNERASFYGLQLLDAAKGERSGEENAQPNANAEPDLTATVTSTAGAENECRDWLTSEFAADPDKMRAKADFQTAALAKFSGRLSARGFMRAWDAVAPQAGRSKPGRKS